MESTEELHNNTTTSHDSPSSKSTLVHHWAVESAPLAMLCVIVMYLRKPHAFVRPQFWAEDALVFFRQAYEFGAGSLFKHYAGYYHTYPRLVALFSQAIPFSFAPLLFNCAALAATLICIFYLCSPRIPVGRKPLLALSLCAVPSGTEVFMNLTNAHWFLAITLILISCATHPVSRKGYITDLFLLFICGLTGPFIIPFSLLFGIKLFRERTVWCLTLFLLSISMAVVQSINIGSSLQYVSQLTEVAYAHVGHVYLGFLFYPLYRDPARGNALETAHFILIIASSLTLLSILWISIAHKQHTPLIFLLSGFLILLSTHQKFRAIPGELWDGYAAYLHMSIWHGSIRYFYIPKVMLMWAILLIIPTHSSWKAIFAFIAFPLMFMFAPSEFQDSKWPNYKWKKRSRCLSRQASCAIPVHPPGWTLHIDTTKTTD